MTEIGEIPGMARYAAAYRPLIGELESGDRYLVQHVDDTLLVAVVDGIGHGHEAASASAQAVAVMARHAGEPAEQLIRRCHDALRSTRGVVMSVAYFDAASPTFTWSGVGNVEGMLVPCHAGGAPKPAYLLPRAGIVGDRLPALASATLPLHDADVLILASDGVRLPQAAEMLDLREPLDFIERFFGRNARSTDDALLLGVKWFNRKVRVQGSTSPGLPAPGSP